MTTNQLTTTQRTQPIIPTDFETAWRMSAAIAKSGLAPKGIDTPEAIFTAIQLGAEVGLTPMSALQNIAVVNGRTTIWGDAQLALVRASGQLEEFSETNEGKEGADDFKAICVATREGYKTPTTNEYSIADAKKAGLWGKSGPWTTNPKRMLKMRARAFTLRDAFPDILKGIYSTEEARDIPQTIDGGTLKSVADLNAEFNAKPAVVMTPHDPVTGEVLSDEQIAKKKAQAVVEELYQTLKIMPQDKRAAGFLDVNGLELLDTAGRNDVCDQMFTELGINLPPR